MSEYKVTIEKDDNSQVIITGEIPSEKLESYREEVVKQLSESVKIDGFRPGHVPENVLKEKVGAMTILQEMAEKALQAAYPVIMRENEVSGIGRPEIAITKLAEGNPLEYKITQAVMPDITLPDYKKIAAKFNAKFDKEATEIVVTDEELDDVIKNVRNSRKQNPQDEKEIAPVLDDAFVKTLGDFETVDDFKTKLRANMKSEKEMRERDKRRIGIVEEIVKDTKVDVPEVMIERQLNQFLAEMRGNVEQMGAKFEDYLKHAKKTEEELKKEARPDAEKKVKFSLVLDAIAKEEKVEAPKEEVDAQVKKIMETYKDASEDGARDYVSGILKNDQVFAMLADCK